MNSKQILENFWATMETNDFRAASQLLHDDYVLDWPQSGERILGRENFAAINTNYPAEGKWHFEIHHILAEGDTAVTDVSVRDEKTTGRAITFSTIREGKIWKQVEFWPDPFEAPKWRAQWVHRAK